MNMIEKMFLIEKEKCKAQKLELQEILEIWITDKKNLIK